MSPDPRAYVPGLGLEFNGVYILLRTLFIVVAVDLYVYIYIKEGL